MIVKTRLNPKEILFNLPIRYYNKKGRGDLNKKIKERRILKIKMMNRYVVNLFQGSRHSFL
jgi:hypothetical protein